MGKDNITLRKEGAFARIILNNPARLSAISMAMWDGIDRSSTISQATIGRWAAAVARASQRRLELALNHRLDELTDPLTQPRVSPALRLLF